MPFKSGFIVLHLVWVNVVRDQRGFLCLNKWFRQRCPYSWGYFAVTLSSIWNLSSKGYFDWHWDCNFSLFSSCKALNQSQSWVETFLTNTFLSASRRRLLKSLSVSQRMRDEIRVSRVPDNVSLVVGMQVAALVAATTHLAHSLRARWGESESLSERAWANSQIIIKKTTTEL